MTLQQAHDRLGHCNEESTRLTVKKLDWEVTGILKPCEPCVIGKAKQKNVPKNCDGKPEVGDKM